MQALLVHLGAQLSVIGPGAMIKRDRTCGRLRNFKFLFGEVRVGPTRLKKRSIRELQAKLCALQHDITDETARGSS